MAKKVVIFGSRSFEPIPLIEVKKAVAKALDDLSIKYDINSIDDIEIITTIRDVFINSRGK